MEIGAFFILLILVVVLGALGAIVYAIAGGLRHKELSPNAEEPGREQRPVHREVENEQSTDFVGTP
jgi:hypothetical protein